MHTQWRIALSALLVCWLAAGTAAGAAKAASGNSVNGPALMGGQTVTYGRGGVDTVRFSLAAVQAGAKVPSDMPQAPVTVTLPLYPGSRETHRPYPLAFVDFPATNYLVATKERFLAGTNIATVEHWYISHMESAGYALTGEATVGSLHTGQTSQGLTFTLRSHPFVSCDLSFEQLRYPATLLQYTVMDVLVPPRQSASLLPAGVQSATVVLAEGSGKRTVTRTIVGPVSLAALVAQMNTLPVDVWNQSACSGAGRYASVRFTLAGGQSVQATVDPDCETVTIGNYVLQSNAKLWRLLTALVRGSAGRA